MKREPNITRIDFARTHGWWVRFQRMDDGGTKRVTSKHFSDGVHGGKRKALAAAKAWRDRMAPKLPRSKRRNLIIAPPGYGYVKRAELPRRSSRAAVYVAWLRIEGRRAKATSRSIALWGELGAKLDCEKWLRREQRALRVRMNRRATA